MPKMRTIPIDQPRLREAFKDTACCDAAHLGDTEARRNCKLPKLLLVVENGEYAVVHMHDRYLYPGWLINAPDEKSRAILDNFKKWNNPLSPSGPLVAKSEDEIANLARTLRLPKSPEPKKSTPKTPTTPKSSPQSKEDRALVSPTDGKRTFVKSGGFMEEDWEMVEGERFELLDGEEIDDEYWNQGGYDDQPPEQWIGQDQVKKKTTGKKW